MIFCGIEKQVASLPKSRKNREAFMNCSNCFKIKIGDVKHILSAKGKFISTNNYLPDITTWLKIYLSKNSACTQIVFECRIIGGNDDLIFFGAAEYPQKGVIR